MSSTLVDPSEAVDAVRRIRAQEPRVVATAERVAELLDVVDDGPDEAASVRVVLEALVERGSLMRHAPYTGWCYSVSREPTVVEYIPPA